MKMFFEHLWVWFLLVCESLSKYLNIRNSTFLKNLWGCGCVFPGEFEFLWSWKTRLRSPFYSVVWTYASNQMLHKFRPVRNWTSVQSSSSSWVWYNSALCCLDPVTCKYIIRVADSGAVCRSFCAYVVSEANIYVTGRAPLLYFSLFLWLPPASQQKHAHTHMHTHPHPQLGCYGKVPILQGRAWTLP